MFGRTDQAHGNERRQMLRDLCTSAASSKQWPVLANKNGGLSDTEWFYVISSTCTFAPGDYGYQSFSISSHCVYLRFEKANNFVIKLAEKWSARQRLQTVMWPSICMTSLDKYTINFFAEKWSARQRLQTVMWPSICMTSLDKYTINFFGVPAGKRVETSDESKPN